MFEIGFSELVMVALVALLVIGPERLPRAARIAGYWIGRTRSVINNAKTEIQLELRAEEMRQLFKEESGLNDIQSVVDETQDTAQAFQSLMTSLSKDSVDLTKRLPHEFE
jgi:sec-independent protein translocase protein TatB